MRSATRIIPDSVLDGSGSTLTEVRLGETGSQTASTSISAEALSAAIRSAVSALQPQPFGPLGTNLPCSAAYVVLLAACVHSGRILVPLPPSLDEAAARPQAAELGCAALALATTAPTDAATSRIDLGSAFASTGLGQYLALEPVEPGASAVSNTPEWGSPAATALILRTSGSTAEPRAVPLRRDAILSRIRWMEEAYPWSPTDIALIKTSPCFVDSIWEALGPLTAGVPMVVAFGGRGHGGGSAGPRLVLEAILGCGVTRAVAVPTLWGMLGREEGQPGRGVARLRTSKLRLAVCSGEALPVALLGALRDSLPESCRILNIYGSTEMHADATCFDATGFAASAAVASVVPVGRCLPGFVVHVVRPAADGQGLEECSPGDVGQILVSGPGLAFDPQCPDGYLSLGTHTTPGAAAGPAEPASPHDLLARAPSYVLIHPPHPAADPPSLAPPSAPPLVSLRTLQGREASRSPSPQTAFLPGDVGYFTPEGDLVVLGRATAGPVLNLGGRRVHVASWAEERMGAHPGVSAAAAHYGPGEEGREAELRVGVVLKAGGVGGTEEGLSLLRWLLRPLASAPDPSHRTLAASLSLLTHLPTAPESGKVRRRDLPRGPVLLRPADLHDSEEGGVAGDPEAAGRAAGGARVAEGPAEAEGAPMRPLSEAEVMAAFQEILGVPLEPQDDFFRSGGDSLAAVELTAILNLPSIDALVRHPTPRSLAAYLRSQASEGEEGLGPAERRGEKRARSPGDGGATPPKPLLVVPDLFGEGHSVVKVSDKASQPFNPWGQGDACVVLGRAMRSFIVGPAALIRPAEPTAELAAAPVLHTLPPSTGALPSANASGVSGAAEGSVRESWSRPLSQCVDGSPVVVAPLVWNQADSSWAPAEGAPCHVFIASHGGSVCCLEGATGRTVWQAELPARIEAGVALDSSLTWLSAASHEGNLHTLRAATGAAGPTFALEGSVRADVATCPGGHGGTWIATQSGHVYRAAVGGAPDAAPQLTEARLPFHETISAAAAFAALPGPSEPYLAVFGTLQGSLVAIRDDAALSAAWAVRGALPRPIFASPVSDTASGLVIACSVEGQAAAFSIEAGQLVWSLDLGGSQVFPAPFSPVFAPLSMALVPGPAAEGGTGPGTAARSVALLTASSGAIAGLNPATGTLEWAAPGLPGVDGAGPATPLAGLWARPEDAFVRRARSSGSDPWQLAFGPAASLLAFHGRLLVSPNVAPLAHEISGFRPARDTAETAFEGHAEVFDGRILGKAGADVFSGPVTWASSIFLGSRGDAVHGGTVWGEREGRRRGEGCGRCPTPSPL